MTRQPNKELQRLERWLKLMLASYTGDSKNADRTAIEAQMELGDLARFEPTTFWKFIEYVAASPMPIERLRGLGAIGLDPLLRHYPDDYDKCLAGLVRRDERFRLLVREVDPDRVAPDVWREIEAALVGD